MKLIVIAIIIIYFSLIYWFIWLISVDSFVSFSLSLSLSLCILSMGNILHPFDLQLIPVFITYYQQSFIQLFNYSESYKRMKLFLRVFSCRDVIYFYLTDFNKLKLIELMKCFIFFYIFDLVS